MVEICPSLVSVQLLGVLSSFFYGTNHASPSLSSQLDRRPIRTAALAFVICVTTLIKKKIKFSSYILEIQNGAVAKSYMTNGLLIYGEIFAHLLI